MCSSKSTECGPPGSVQPDDPTRTSFLLELRGDGVEENAAAAAAEVEGVSDGGPVVDGVDDALCHLAVEWSVGVDEVSGGEEEAYGGDSGDGAGESRGETGDGGGGRERGEEGEEKRAGGCEVNNKEKGEKREEKSMEDEKEKCVPLLHAVDGVDL